MYHILKDEYGLDPALQDYSSVLKLQPDNYWATLEIGHIYLYDLKDMDLAESYYRQALAANREYPYAYFYLGEVYKMRGDNATVAYWYRQALEREPDWQTAIEAFEGAGIEQIRLKIEFSIHREYINHSFSILHYNKIINPR